ncbi:hypothetical protein [Paenibacillus sp. KN14-4R]|uniref:hypothetical protein n=1 Tax=Paenibacillus sp. KN14-4R TaxID=3445773 RepID=UPI003FA171E3
MRETFIVAIAAVSGGGKSTITTQLSKMLPNARALFFDEYEFDGPDDICEWVERGGDCNEWDIAPMIRDIDDLMSDSSTLVNFILLDYPFAYSHSEMLPYIDFTVFIDIPLDIAMARRILRDFEGVSLDEILKDLHNYLLRGRDAYLNMLNTTKPSSDLVLDGSLPIDVIVERITAAIKELQ